MDRITIEEVYLDQNEKITQKKDTILRDINIEKTIKTTQIVVISGVRRSGKSTLLLHLMKNYSDFSYLNFDDERLINFEVQHFQELLLIFKKHSKSKVVFFDEIQNIPNWERFIRRIFDENYKIFITGSNAKLLSSELTTHLTGRYIKIEMYPFSFLEILRYNNLTVSKLTSNTKSKILTLFDKYLKNGGFPDYIKYQDDEFLKRVYDDVIYKDLIARFKIRNIKQFKKLSQYLFTNFTSEISYNSLKNILSIKSSNTIQEYISYLEESWLLFELYKYDYSLKKQFVSNKKIYCIDNGVRNIVSFKFSDDNGRLLENMVFLELKRRQKELYFYKSKNNKEIDFLYQENGMYHLIQVAYSVNDVLTKKRELLAFVEANKELKKTENLLLTYNEEETIQIDKLTIELKPVWKWLLHI